MSFDETLDLHCCTYTRGDQANARPKKAPPGCVCVMHTTYICTNIPGMNMNVYSLFQEWNTPYFSAARAAFLSPTAINNFLSTCFSSIQRSKPPPPMGVKLNSFRHALAFLGGKLLGIRVGQSFKYGSTSSTEQTCSFLLHKIPDFSSTWLQY